MNRKYTTILLLIFGCVSIFIGISYACDPVEIYFCVSTDPYNDPDGPYYINTGESMLIGGKPKQGSQIPSSWAWTVSAGLNHSSPNPPNPITDTIRVSPSTVGEYSVEVTAYGDGAEATIAATVYVTTPAAPTPGIIEDDWYQYTPVGQTVKVDGYDSYDNDENGYRIDVWEWGVFKWNGSEFVYQSYSDTFTSDEYFTLWDPGVYQIKLYVRDDEEYWSSSYDYCYIYVVKVDIAAGLTETDELNPGLYINANWDDDDGDGWSPNDNPPSGVYTGDKADSEITGGDNDFRTFVVTMSSSLDEIQQTYPNSKVSITYPSNVKVWTTVTKKTAQGASSELTSGSEISVADLPKTLYLEGVSGSSSFRDIDLKATWNSTEDIVKVTVFEVELTGIYSGDQQIDNDKHLSSFYASSDENGKISWNDADGDGTTGDYDYNCLYFHNCMECQGTPKPSSITTEVEFDFNRKKWERAWEKKGTGNWQSVVDNTPWTPDDLVETDEDKTPSCFNYIYHIDGPGILNLTTGPTRDYVAHIIDLKEWIMVKIDGTWYQCSDFYKWHSKIYTAPIPPLNLNMTRSPSGSQELGSDWITVPSNP
jgi:hypothetical protein